MPKFYSHLVGKKMLALIEHFKWLKDPLDEYEIDAIIEYKEGKHDPSKDRDKVKKDRNDVKKFLQFLRKKRL
jgi:hypothetical protein